MMQMPNDRDIEPQCANGPCRQLGKIAFTSSLMLSPLRESYFRAGNDGSKLSIVLSLSSDDLIVKLCIHIM